MTEPEWTTHHVTINLPASAATAHHRGHDLRVQHGGRLHQWQTLIDGAVIDESCTNRLDAQRLAELRAERMP